MRILFSSVNHTEKEVKRIRLEFNKHNLNVVVGVGHRGFRSKFSKEFPNAEFFEFSTPKDVGEWDEYLDWDAFNTIMAKHWHTILPLADRHPPYEGGTSKSIVRAAKEFSIASKILHKHDIDAVVFFKEPERLLEYFVYKLSSLWGIKVLLTRPGLEQSSAFASESYEDACPAKKSINTLRDQISNDENKGTSTHAAVRPEVSRIQNAAADRSYEYSPLYMKQQKLLLQPKSYWRNLFNRHAYGNCIKSALRPNTGQWFQWRMLRKYRKQALNWDALKREKERVRTTVFFPLHYQPEQTTLPLAGIAMHQILMVKLLAQRLPEDAAIIVKEHPSIFKSDSMACISFRDYDYYSDLASIKNVTLASLEVPSLQLQNLCNFTATIRGTASFEAAISGRWAVVFAESPYKKFPNVIDFFEANDEEWHGFLSATTESCDLGEGNKFKEQQELVFSEFDSLSVKLCEIDVKELDIWANSSEASRALALFGALSTLKDSDDVLDHVEEEV